MEQILLNIAVVLKVTNSILAVERLLFLDYFKGNENSILTLDICLESDIGKSDLSLSLYPLIALKNTPLKDLNIFILF